jgi:hypothetical protein
MKPKYKLNLSGDFIDTTISLDINLSNDEEETNNPTLFFNGHDELLDFCDDMSKSTSHVKNKLGDFYIDKFGLSFINRFFNDEKIGDKASILLQTLFLSFKVDYINLMNWKVFKKMMNVKSPEFIHNSIILSDDIEQPLTLTTFIKNNALDEKQLETVSVAIKGNTLDIYQTSFCNNSRELMIATLDNIFDTKESAVIKRCENCNRLYIPKKIDGKYCDKTSPQDINKTCKQAMDYKKKNESLSDPIKKLYKNVNNTLFSEYDKAKTKESRLFLQHFRKENLLKAKQYKDNIITEDEYSNWLKSFYKRNRSDTE